MSIDDVDSSVMEKFDQQIWEDIIAWQKKQNKTRKLPPKLEKARTKVGEVASSAKDRASEMPGIGLVMESFQNSMQGLMDIVSKAGESSVREKAVLKRYKKKRGHEFHEIDEILGLPLKEVIKTKPNLELKYSSAAMVEGGAVGFVTTGGTTSAILGTGIGGVGALPGAGITAGAIATDIAAVMAASSRVIAETAAYYGFDLKYPNEQVFASTILSLALSPSDGAQKQAAYTAMSRLMGDLARRKGWEQLNKNVVTQLMSKVYSSLGVRLTQKKLAQAVPVLGIAVGAGLNAKMLKNTATTADYMYRQRFLIEKYNLGDTLVGSSRSSDSDVEEDVDFLLETVLDSDDNSE